MAAATIVSDPSTIHCPTGRLLTSSVACGGAMPTAGLRTTRPARSSGRISAARTLLAITARSASSTVARVMVTSTTCVASTIWITARLRPLRL